MQFFVRCHMWCKPKQAHQPEHNIQHGGHVVMLRFLKTFFVGDGGA